MTRIARIKYPSQLPFLIGVIRVIRGVTSAWLSGGIHASGEATSDNVSCTPVVLISSLLGCQLHRSIFSTAQGDSGRQFAGA